MDQTKVVRLTLLRWGTVVNMRSMLGRRMAGVYIRQSIAIANEPSICTDCGIDLPTTWHWDGCSKAATR